jgi:hypothetical protein
MIRMIPDFVIEFDRARNMTDMIAQPVAPALSARGHKRREQLILSITPVSKLVLPAAK